MKRSDYMKKKLVIVLLLSLILVSSGNPALSDASQNNNIKITDARGETIIFDSPPERIVSFMASNTEILFHLGLGDRIVGVDKYSNYPPETADIPKVGDSFSVDYEKIVSLEPDVVVITMANTNIIDSLQKYDLKVVVTGGTKIYDVYSDIELLGKMCGIEERANSIADDLKETMEKLTDETRDLPKKERPKIFYIAGTYQGIYTPGNNTFQHTLIQRAGGNNIASDKKNWATISQEEIIADDPEIIIAPDSLKRSVQTLIKKDSWKGIEAVKNDQIFYVNGDIMSRPGPRIIDAQLKLINIMKVVRSDAQHADLLIKDITFSPSQTIINGTSVNITATIENIGQLDAVNVNISFWCSSNNSQNKTLLNNSKINIIEDKTSISTDKFEWECNKVGKYTITAEIDEDNQTLELNEENNIFSSEVIVKEEKTKNDETPSISTTVFIAVILLLGIILHKDG